MVFKDRAEAGRFIANQLSLNHYKNTIVITIPNSSVPISLEVAEKLNSPLDILSVRKISVPGEPDYEIGAVTEGNFHWMNPFAVEAINLSENEWKQILRDETLA